MLNSLPYIEQLIVFICVYGLLAAGLNLVMGYGGMFTISHAALFGVGAYTTALAEIHWGLNFAPAFGLAILATALVGAATAFPAIRLRGDYLIVASLAVQVVGLTLFTNMDSVTNGTAGIRSIPYPRIGSLVLDNNRRYVIFAAVLFLIVLLLMRVWTRSPWGRLLMAVRDDDIAAASLGKNVAVVKLTAFALSAGIAGLAGGIYADYITFISPESFNLDRSIVIVAALIIGGTGMLYGPVVGGIVVIVLPELLRLIPMPSDVAASIQQLVYGLLLVVFMVYRSQGLAVRSKSPRLTSPFAGSAVDEPIAAPVPRRDSGDRLIPVPRRLVSGGGGREDVGEPPLTVSDVSKRFGGVAALSGVTFAVPEGQVTGIIGPNGAGKTSLLDVVTGFVAPDSGEVRLYGRRLTGQQPFAIARQGVIRLFQEARVFPELTLRENVASGFTGQPRESWHRFADRRSAIRASETRRWESARGLLARVGLEHKADHPAGALSYGQQKLLCLARALASDPKVLLLDEPCVGLALPMIEVLREFIFSLVEEGRTVVVIEHNLEFVRASAHNVIFMHEGRVEAMGTPADVLADDRLGRLYFGVAR